MANIPGAPFGGEQPIIAPEHLANGMAAVAQNVRLLSGRLEAERDLLSMGVMPKASLGDVRSLYFMDVDGANGGPFPLHWFDDGDLDGNEMTWPRVDVAKPPIPGDLEEQTIYTGAGAPKVTTRELATGGVPVGAVGRYPYRWLLLGAPAPTDVPQLSVTAAIDDPTLLDLENGGAEDGTLFWTIQSGNFNAVANGTIPGFNAKEGTHFFSFLSEASAEIRQVVAAANLLEGQALTLRWWQASGANLSQAGMRLEFLNGIGGVIGDPVESAVQAGDVLTWGERTLSTTVPAAVAEIRVTMLATKVGGGTTDVYIDDIRLSFAEASLSYDCNSFSPFITKPDSGGGNSFNRLRIRNDIGRPAGCIEYEGDSRDGWLYRNFGGLNSAKVVFSVDTYTHPSNTNSVSLFAGNSGACFAVNVAQTSGIRVVQRSTWDNIDGTLVESLTSVDASGRWLTIRCEITLLDALRGSLKVAITDSDTSEILVDGTDAIEIPINGGLFGWSAVSNFNSRYSWLDNVSFVATPPQPAAEDQISGTFYVYTLRTSRGYESAPSPVSQTIRRNDGSIVEVTTETDFGTWPALYGVDTKVFYRASGNPAQLLYVGETPLDQAVFVDDLDSAELGEPLATDATWGILPDDTHSVLALANLITIFFADNRAMPSPVGKPYTSPSDWWLSTDHKIMGAGTVDTDVVVLTQGRPYYLTGSDPSALNMSKMEEAEGCSSSRSIVTLSKIGVAYATPKGLASIMRGQYSLLTGELISQEQWQALNPQSILGCTHDGRYIGFYDTGVEDPDDPPNTIKGGFIFDPNSQRYTWTRINFHATAAALNPFTGQLHLVIDGTRYLWNGAASKRQYLYRSGTFVMPIPIAFEAAQVLRVGTGSLIFRLFVDGELAMEKVIDDDLEFVLPAVLVKQALYWELEGDAAVKITPRIATSMDELV